MGMGSDGDDTPGLRSNSPPSIIDKRESGLEFAARMTPLNLVLMLLKGLWTPAE